MSNPQKQPPRHTREIDPALNGPSGAPLRAFSIGTLLCILIGTGTIYANCIIIAASMFIYNLSPAC